MTNKNNIGLGGEPLGPDFVQNADSLYEANLLGAQINRIRRVRVGIASLITGHLGPDTEYAFTLNQTNVEVS
jgi:hypothetical protein